MTYTTSQVAAMVGRSGETIKRWRRRGVYRPAEFEMNGTVKVWKYTEEDVANIRTLVKASKPGPKPKRDTHA